VKKLIKDDINLLDKKNKDKWGSPLYYTCRSNQFEIVKWLLECGADPEITQTNGSTSLHVASWYGWPKIVKYLLERGANPYVKSSFKNNPRDDRSKKSFC